MTKSFNPKNLGALLLTLVCLISLLPFSHASGGAHEGKIGESEVYWNLDDNGTLTVSGKSTCLAFTSKEEQPWAEHRSEICAVYFDPGAYLTNLDISYWFDDCENLSYVSLTDAVRVIGTRTFANCPSLGEIRISSDREDFKISKNAFYLSGSGHMEVLLEKVSVSVFSAFSLYDFAADHRSVCIDSLNEPSKSNAPANLTTTKDGGTRATGYCINCDGTYSYSLGYSDMGSCHAIRHWCSNCGLDQCGGTNIEDHTYGSNGICTKCGHDNGSGGGGSGGDDPDPPYVCYHPSTYTTWSGCYWYEYCSYCGELIDSGVSHNYSYGSWTYYNTTRHKRTGTCTRCGATTTDYENHTKTTKYDPYDAAQHEKYSYCADCDSRIGTATKEDHTFSYGNWRSYNATQHRRSKTCSKCGYQEYEYENHSLSHGNWTRDTTDNTRHKRTVSCLCGYSATEYADHNFTVQSVTSLSDTYHRVVKRCTDCLWIVTETEAHSFTYGTWESIDETHHRRQISCSCGYESYEYANHHDDDNDGFCDDCGKSMTIRFSVTVPASLSIIISPNGDITAATNARIVNHSARDVAVSSLSISGEDGWSLVDYAHNMALEKVDSKKIGFMVNNVATNQIDNDNTARFDLSGSNNWRIETDGELPLSYGAVVSATSQPITDEQVLTLCFVVGWAA